MNTFTNTDSTIDSRDIIERIEELKSTERNTEEHEELIILLAVAEECKQYSDDWEYGSTLIHRDYFETYMDEMVEDCYEIPKEMPDWMSIKLDYDALEQDYTSVDFDGQEYLIR